MGSSWKSHAPNVKGDVGAERAKIAAWESWVYLANIGQIDR